MLSTTALSLKRKLVSIAVFASLGCVAVPASATVSHIVENGILMGANNVDVLGNKYDVRFIDGSFSSVFASRPFPFQDSGSAPNHLAYNASLALNEQVILDISGGDFDTNSALMKGCGDFFRCNVLTPYMTDSKFDAQVVTNNSYNVGWLYSKANDIGTLYDIEQLHTDDSNQSVWAVWSLTTAVPEPSTYAMLSLGLLGLIGVRRRRQG